MTRKLQCDENLEALDRVLGRDGEIVPSSGFAGSVMDAVRRQREAPAPISFPWIWALPAWAACAW